MFLIISDLHQGLCRKSGVTTESLEQLENDKIRDLTNLLAQNKNKEVIIAGDLFDSYRVPLHTVLQVATALLDHPKKIWIIAGNHDLSKNTLEMSSLMFFSKWLAMYHTNVSVIFEPTTMIKDNILLVPHMPNQDIFNRAIVSAKADVLITHCNYENDFTIEKDHSLNLTKEQASNFKMVISGHEHNKRTVGNVHMVGSFAPCNVGEAAIKKCSHIFDSTALTLLPVSATKYKYKELFWQDLNVLNSEAEFLNIVGEATAAEAPTVLNAVASLRKKSSSYMIKNSVTVETIELGSVDGASFDSIDIMGLLSGILDKKYIRRLEEFGYVIN